MTGSSTSDTVNPVSDQCELAGVPCVTSDDPWQAWFFPRKGDPKKGFEWTYHFFWGFDMVGNMFADMWLSMPTNKMVGDDVHQRSRTASPPDDPEHGTAGACSGQRASTSTISGSIRRCRDDFSAQIAEHEKGECRNRLRHFQSAAIRDLLDAVRAAGLQAENRDAAQGGAVSRPPSRRWATAASACRPRCGGRTTIRSSRGLTGETAQQYCDAYEKATGKQWTQPLGFKHRQSRGRDRRAQARQEARADRDPRRHRPDRLSVDRRSDHLEGRAARTRCRTCAPRRWSAASGKRARSSSTTWNIVFNKTAPNIPLDSPFEAIKYS